MTSDTAIGPSAPTAEEPTAGGSRLTTTGRSRVTPAMRSWLTRIKAKPGKPDQLRSIVHGFGVAAVLFTVILLVHGNSSSTYRIDSHWGAFTGLFILALAIERALEPFSRRLGPDTTEAKKVRDHHRACVAADGKAASEKAQDGVEDQYKVDRCRRLTAVVTWGWATGLAFVLCGELNITLMQAVRSRGSGAPPFWADLLVTGLVVGAGTKPLHDLISNIERVKEGRSADGSGAR